MNRFVCYFSEEFPLVDPDSVPEESTAAGYPMPGAPQGVSQGVPQGVPQDTLVNPRTKYERDVNSRMLKGVGSIALGALGSLALLNTNWGKNHVLPAFTVPLAIGTGAGVYQLSKQRDAFDALLNYGSSF